MRSFRASGAAALATAAALAMSGCSEGGLGASLRQAGVSSTPDEFLVLPTKPLEIPDNLLAQPLPTPTTGSSNRVDYNPRVEAVAGLTGGSGALPTASGAALVARVPPGSPEIRATLVVEDAQYRSQNRGRLLERWFSRDQDALIYRGMSLNQAFEFERLRGQGVEVPPSPPNYAAPS